MKYIRFFDQVRLADTSLVGGKNASLGEMIAVLTDLNIRVPFGFALTTEAYKALVLKNNLTQIINELVELKNFDGAFVEAAGQKVRNAFLAAVLPDDVVQELEVAYQDLEKRYGKNCSVAVRSSATTEDSADASFAGQQETFLHVSGIESLKAYCIKAYASLFTDRAIIYRAEKGFDQTSVALSLGIQKMVQSDKATSGIMFTLDTESGFKDVVYITAAYGLGENIVQGAVNPDEYYVHKPTLAAGFESILKKRCGEKATALVHDLETKKIILTDIAPEKRTSFALSDSQILELARAGCAIEKHYSQVRNCWSPMDIEWACDAEDGLVYVVQARPETVHALDKKALSFTVYQREGKQAPLCSGKRVGSKIVSGTARVILKASAAINITEGDILVTEMTDPDWVGVMKRAGAIVTNRGGRTCHAAIVSRELGLPALVGTINGTEVIRDGQQITVDCSIGEIGYVFDGVIPFSTKTYDMTDAKTPVPLLLNIGNPDEAFSLASLPVEGVGLARLEFIINSSIKIHPMALVHPEQVTDSEVAAQISQVTKNFTSGAQYFVETLAQEVGTIAAAFYPKPVLIRFSDFKSNEYRDLIGGSFFEPHEENPMIGFRGASRYYHERYREAFLLECAAIKRVREHMGLTNLNVMVPFVRTLTEAREVLKIIEDAGLKSGAHGLLVYMMCEIPANVILLEKFAEYFDGFSIGSNDLTQTILAIDRDSELVASHFDERNEAVKEFIALAIKKAHACKKPIGICGQAPSDYPDFAQWLVGQGITSLSLTADAVLVVRQQLTG